MRILLVDDHALLAVSLAMALRAAGHLVVGPVSTARDGMAMAEQIIPDLALVSLSLREGSCGVALAREMLGRFGTPVLFLRGQALDARPHAEATIGALARPYSPAAVIAGIEAARAIDAGDPLPSGDMPAELELYRQAA